MYDEILFPTDGSAGADAALEHAIELAETHDATIHVLNVVDATYLGGAAAEATTVEALRQQGDEAVEAAVEWIAARDVEVVRELRQGEPYAEIVDYANEAGVDVIVMGTRGRRGLDRYLLGSVTEKVVRTADVPVLTIRLSD